jgi:hypothetical protein
MNTEWLMEPRIESTPGNSNMPGSEQVHAPLKEDDAELEREFGEMAELLFELYLWRIDHGQIAAGE